MTSIGVEDTDTPSSGVAVFIGVAVKRLSSVTLSVGACGDRCPPAGVCAEAMDTRALVWAVTTTDVNVGPPREPSTVLSTCTPPWPVLIPPSDMMMAP